MICNNNKNMEVHRCTFVFSLQQVRLTTTTDNSPIEVVWHSQKGDTLMRGATKPKPKRAVALFNQNFQLKCQLLRDQQTESYRSSIILLQIRRASSALEQSISSSICKFDLAQIISEGQFLQKRFKAEDGSFQAVISGSCNQIENTGILRKKSSSKKMKSNSSAMDRQSSISKVQRTKVVSKRGGSQKMQRERENTAKKWQIKCEQLQDKYEKEQAQHILTQQKLKQTEQNLVDYQNLVNQMSVSVSQKQTLLIETHLQLQETKAKLVKLTKEHKLLKQNRIAEDKQQDQQESVKQKEVRAKEEEVRVKEEEVRAKEEEVSTKLKERIKQLQHSLQAMSQNYNIRVKAESQLQTYSQKLEEQNHSQEKQIQRLRKQLLQSSWQKDQLRLKMQKAEEEKVEIKKRINQWKTQFLEQNQRNKSELTNNEQQYQKMFDLYQQFKERLKAIGEQVPRHQIVQLQQFYQEKVKAYEDKQIILKRQVEQIEEEMNELQSLLQESEDREAMLVQHTKKLQIELDNVSGENGWWTKIINQELGIRQSVSLRSMNGEMKHSELTTFEEKYKKLLKILLQNGRNILLSEKQRKTIERLQQREQHLSNRVEIGNDELKEVKERLVVIIKENKKLLQRNTKLNRDYEQLSQKYRKTQDQLNKSQQKFKLLQDDNDIVGYRLGMYQKQVQELKILLEAHHQASKDVVPSIIQSMATKTVSSYTPMPVIKQQSGQLLTSMELKGTKSSKEQINASVIRQLSDLLGKRKKAVEQLNLKSSEEGSQGLLAQIKQVQRTTTRLKTVLLRSGNKAVMQEWLSSVKRLEGLLQASKSK